MIVRTMVEICAKLLISQLKIGGAMAISHVAMATATLILFLDVVFELIKASRVKYSEMQIKYKYILKTLA